MHILCSYICTYVAMLDSYVASKDDIRSKWWPQLCLFTVKCYDKMYLDMISQIWCSVFWPVLLTMWRAASLYCNYEIFKPGACQQHMNVWFFEIAFFCDITMCVAAPKAINYIHVILNLYNQLNKFVTFRNVTKQFFVRARL